MLEEEDGQYSYGAALRKQEFRACRSFLASGRIHGRFLSSPGRFLSEIRGSAAVTRPLRGRYRAVTSVITSGQYVRFAPPATAVLGRTAAPAQGFKAHSSTGPRLRGGRRGGHSVVGQTRSSRKRPKSSVRPASHTASFRAREIAPSVL